MKPEIGCNSLRRTDPVRAVRDLTDGLGADVVLKEEEMKRFCGHGLLTTLCVSAIAGLATSARSEPAGKGTDSKACSH